MDETAFNLSMRKTLRLQGMTAIHIKEADEPGASDLVISKAEVLVAWAELKVDDEPLRVSQVEFLRERDMGGETAVVIRLTNGTGMITVERPARPDGWSTDPKKLIAFYRTMRQTEFDWMAMFIRLRRPRRHGVVK